MFMYSFFHLCATPSYSKGTGMSVEGGNLKCYNFYENCTNRLCKHFFHLCATLSIQRGLERLQKGKLQNGSISTKTVSNRLCIVCLRLCTNFFRMCETTSDAKGAGTSIDRGKFRMVWFPQKRYQSFVYKFFSFVWNPFAYRKKISWYNHARKESISGTCRMKRKLIEQESLVVYWEECLVTNGLVITVQLYADWLGLLIWHPSTIPFWVAWSGMSIVNLIV